MSRRAGRRVAVAAAVAVLAGATAGCSGVSLGQSSPTSSSKDSSGTPSAPATTSRSAAPPDATLGDLAGILVPAYCQMPATRLDNGTVPPATSGTGFPSGDAPSTGSPTSAPSSTPSSASSAGSNSDWRPGGAPVAGNGELSMTGPSAPVLADVNGDGAKEVIAQYLCDAGGTTWPAMLVVVKHGGEVIGTVKLGDIARTEHAQVTSWRPEDNGLVVDWVAYEGGGFDKRPYENLLTMSGSAISFSPTERGRALGQTTIIDGASSSSFATPTGKVACTLDGADATCAVQQPTWKPDGDVTCGTVDGVLLRNGHAAYGCTAAAPFRQAAAAGQPRWQRQGSDPTIRGPFGDMAALAYGRTLTTGQVTCTAAISGVTCTDPLSGHGFTVSGDTARLF